MVCIKMHDSSIRNMSCIFEAIEMNVCVIKYVDLIIDKYLKVNMNKIKLFLLGGPGSTGRPRFYRDSTCVNFSLSK